MQKLFAYFLSSLNYSSNIPFLYFIKIIAYYNFVRLDKQEEIGTFSEIFIYLVTCFLIEKEYAKNDGKTAYVNPGICWAIERRAAFRHSGGQKGGSDSPSGVYGNLTTKGYAKLKSICQQEARGVSEVQGKRSPWDEDEAIERAIYARMFSCRPKWHFLCDPMLC